MPDPYLMTIPTDYVVHDPCFLRMQVELHFAHHHLGSEFRTLSAKHLYFNIAQSLLAQQNTKSRQPLKVLSHPFTDRIIRDRINEFECSGLIQVIYGENDKRTKHLIPTQQLLHKLNHHMKLLRQISERHMYLVEKI
jgi:hypothetical protein